MHRLMKLVAITVLFSLAPGVAWATSTSDATPRVVTAALSDVSTPSAATPAAPAIPPPSIRGSVEALRQSSLVLLDPPERTAEVAAQSGGGRRMSTAAKAAIWIAAVTVTSVWAYKTFSVTRGTD